MLQCLVPVVGVAAVCIGCYDKPAYRDNLTDLQALIGSAVTPQSAIEGASAESTASGGTAGVAEDADLRAKANLHQIDGSGVKARIEFVDDGTTLFISGTAQGLDPSQSYLTLIYDNGSHPAGPNACVPTIFDPQDPDSLSGRMIIGFWEVDLDGNGSLRRSTPILARTTSRSASSEPRRSAAFSGRRLPPGPLRRHGLRRADA